MNPTMLPRLTTFSPQFDRESPYYISDRTTYNWQDELVKQNAINQAYDLKVSGGTEKIDYYVSGGFFKSGGHAARQRTDPLYRGGQPER